MPLITKWRFLDTGAGNAFFNMALDEVLFRTFESGKSRPLFRLYSFCPKAVSVGIFQKSEAILHRDKCLADGVDVVKRPTGGAAVFHENEITYSIVCGADTCAGISVKESYGKLNSFLIDSYRCMGLPADFAGDARAGGENSGGSDFCFASREHYDIIIGGKKMGGGAQKRRRGVILQHGSVPLSIDFNAVKRYFRNGAYGISEKAGSLRNFGVKKKESELKKILKTHFMKNLNVKLEKDSITPEENSAAEELQKIKREGN